MAAIWILSDRPLPIETPAGSDKILHAGAYAVVGALMRWAAGPEARDPGASRWAWLAVAAYGAIDEFHQSFVPGRTPSVGDWAADAIGAWIGVRAAAAIVRTGGRNGRTV